MKLNEEEVYNKKELIKILKKTDKNENEEVFIKDLDTDEYKRIICIRIDNDGDLIIEVEGCEMI